MARIPDRTRIVSAGLGLAALAAVFTLPACSDGGGKAPAPSGADGETSVLYSDMIEAYAAGDVARGRELAGEHLTRFEREYETAPGEDDREAALIRQLGTIRSALEAEARLDPSQRLRASDELGHRLEEALGRALSRQAGLPEDASQKAYLFGEIGHCAAAFLRMEDGVAPPSAMERLHAEYAPAIREAGYSDLDAVLRGGRSGIAEPGTLILEGAGRERVWETVRGYYQGLLRGDAEQLAEAAGLPLDDARELTRSFAAELARSGVSDVLALTLPAPPDPLVLLAGREPGTYRLSVRGIEVEVATTGGGRETQSWNKLLHLRRGEGSEWRVER